MQQTATEKWRQQVLEEHRQLNEVIDRLRGFLACPRPRIGERGSHSWASELSRHLVEFHDMLFRHFRFEEEGGMMRDLRRAHPRATRPIEELVGEHGELLGESRELMADVLAYSEGIRPAETRLRVRLTSLMDRLKEHERLENTMILDLMYEDLGQGD